MVAPEGIPPPDENYVMAARREKLERLREQGNAFPNTFRRDTLAEWKPRRRSSASPAA